MNRLPIHTSHNRFRGNYPAGYPPPTIPEHHAGYHFPLPTRPRSENSEYEKVLTSVLQKYSPKIVWDDMKRYKPGAYSLWEGIVGLILRDKTIPRKYYNRILDDYMKYYTPLEGRGNIEDNLKSFTQRRRVEVHSSRRRRQYRSNKRFRTKKRSTYTRR